MQWLISLAVSYADRVAPHHAATVVLAGAAVLTLLIGLIRRGGAFAPSVPGVLYVLAAASAFWPTFYPHKYNDLFLAAVAVAGALLIAHLVLFDRREQRAAREASTDAAVESEPASTRGYWIAGLLLGAFFVFYDLGGYAGSVLTWESPVTYGFAEAVQAGVGVWDFFLRRFLWDDGVLSAGHTSLYYGAPTYALFRLAGFSGWTLRFFAAVAAVLSIALLGAIARAHLGRVAGAALVVAFALNPAVIFYGHYGSSASGTMLGVVLALGAVWVFLADGPHAWWMSAVAATLLFLATLNYAPGRLVVVALLATVALATLLGLRRLSWRRAVGVVLIAAGIVLAWRFEEARGRQQLLFNARGEQFFAFIEQPAMIKGLFGRDLSERPFRPDTVCDKIELLVRVVGVTAPQYTRLVSPRLRREMPGAVIAYDPPPLELYFAPLVLFVVWGIGVSLIRLPDWRHLCLFLWLGAVSLGVMMTNRVDAHRTMLLTVPFSLWAALGLQQAVALLREAGVPRPLGHLIGILLTGTAVFHNLAMQFYVQQPPLAAAQALTPELEAARGPVVLGTAWDHREIGWIHLRSLERARRDPKQAVSLMPEGIRNGIQDDNPNGSPSPAAVREVRQQVQKSTVIMAPSNRFRKAAALLQQQGARVSERGTEQFRFYRIDAGAEATGIADEEIRPLPTIFVPPTPTPIPLQQGPQARLADLPALDVKYLFAPPKMNTAWDDTPIVMNGVKYEHGIGMHATAQLSYDVPPNAVALQAIIGLSDTVKPCEKAAVTFEVRGAQNELLFDSDLVDNSTGVRPIHVPVKGKSRITLLVTDGGNGIDCDHANWAMAAFLLSR